MSPFRVGLIGCGSIAQSVHLKILTRLPNVELIGIAEVDSERLKVALARASRAVPFTDYRELLDMPKLEGVVICLPNALHPEATEAALRKGKHVYLEKPLATSLKQAQPVLATWRDSGLIGMIGFNYRFHPLYLAARNNIQSGKLGEPVYARSIFTSSSGNMTAWKKTRLSGGGVLLDLASHHIDVIPFLFGAQICKVFADLRSQRTEEDQATLQIWLTNGLVVQSFFSMNAPEEDRLEIYARKGTLRLDRHRSRQVNIQGLNGDPAPIKRAAKGIQAFLSPYGIRKLLQPKNEPSYKLALAHFVRAITENRPASPDLLDGYRSLAVIEAAEESARTGRIVSVDQPLQRDA
jgi:myo-inositol 2-dehydrogenase/D-chiro-inositol 1-dehydrogenase